MKPLRQLRQAIDDYIRLRRSLGFKLRDMADDLANFATFMEQKAAPYVTTELAMEWAMQPADHQPSDWAQRLSFVRLFARHRHATDLRTDISPIAGKTIVGLAAMELVGQTTLVLTTSLTAVHQWRRELLDKTILRPGDIAEYTGERKDIGPVTLSTYQILTWARGPGWRFPAPHSV